jgi:predicted RNA-binding Zn ribbon-like protein
MTGRATFPPPGRLRHPDGHEFAFDTGVRCLYFIYTGGEGRYAFFETLHEPDDLVAWLGSWPLHAAVEATDEATLAHAKRLRQAMWVAAQTLADGEPLPPEVVAELNAAAKPAPLVPRFEAAGGGTLWAEPATTGQALATLAREAVDLFGGPLAAKVRRCSADNCPLVFVDTSRAGARRWCSMERCGNRAKVRSHRARTKSSG